MLKIHSLKVGRGDCIILQYNPNKSINKSVMIDMRVVDEYINFDTFISYLENQNIYLSSIIITHPHKDHFVGINQLILYLHKKGIIPEIYISPLKLGKAHASLSDEYKSFLKLYHHVRGESILEIDIEEWMNYFNFNTIEFEKPFSVELTEEVSLKIIPPSKKLWKEENLRSEKNRRNPNLYSLFCELLIKNNRFIFCGDIEEPTWKHLLKNGSDHVKNVRFFKFSHHGSKNGFPEILKDKLELFDPSDGLITNGRSESYKGEPRFPDKITRSRIINLIEDKKINFRTHEMRELCGDDSIANRLSIIFKYNLENFQMERDIGKKSMSD